MMVMKGSELVPAVTFSGHMEVMGVTASASLAIATVGRCRLKSVETSLC